MDSATIRQPNGVCHIVAMPHPGRGHINPMMNLCNLLVSQKSDILITFVLTEEWLGLIGSEAKPDNIRFATIPNVIPSEKDRAADMVAFFEAIKTKMEAPFEQLLDGLEPAPSAIVADTFLPWAIAVGNRRNISAVSFWPMCGSIFSVFHHFHLFRQNGHFPIELLDLLCFPSNPSLYLCIAISGDAYPKPTAMTCKYAPRSSSQNGSCPLVHPVMLQGTEYPLGACPFDPFLDLTSLSFQLGYLVDFLADEDLLVGDGLSYVLLTFVSGNLADGYFRIAIDPLNDLSFQLDVAAGGCALPCGGAAGSSSLSATVLANQDCGLAWFRPTMFVVFRFLFGPFGLCCLLLLASGRPS